jgi:phosphoheptose isomerase
VFARQVKAIGKAGDVLIAISTSGTSPNVISALAAARDRGLVTIALVGAESNPDLDACDLLITIPDPSTPRIQEMHLVVLHLICELVDNALAAE